MEMNGIVLLSLIFPVIAHPDYYHRSASRTRPRGHMSDHDQPIRDRYTDMDENRTHTTESTSQRGRGRGFSDIVYPSDGMPKCTHGLCENVAGYPKDRIRNLLSRSEFAHEFFEVTEEFVNLDNRFSSDEMSLCETTVHTIYPEKANNTNQIEKIIVNVEGHKQGVVFETCVDHGQCKFSSTFPSGYTSYCKQKFIHKRLMVLGDNDKFVFDSFEVPSCCVCTVKKTE